MRLRTSFSSAFYLKCGALALLFLLFGLVAACGSGSNDQANSSNPLANGAVDINGSNSSPTPPLSPYLCGAWVTNTSPAFSPDRPISVFAKYVQTNAPQNPGNPVGVDGATATATIQWPDGSSESVTAKTTADGLAVIPILVKPDAANKLVIVQVSFSKDGADPCSVQPAYFTPILVSPTAAPQPTDTGGGPFDTPTPTVAPTVVIPILP
jgi:hypothetical protein